MFGLRIPTLYAATQCRNLDKEGHLQNYRKVVRPACDKSDGGYGGRPGVRNSDNGWPNNASHDEESFGYLLNVGAHSLCRFSLTLMRLLNADRFVVEYAFKEDANPDVLPVYRAGR